MKKFTIMLMAAFIAVATWAQPMVQKNHQVLPEQFAVKTAKDLKQFTPVKKEMTPRQAFKGKVKVPVQKRHAKKAAPKKAFAYVRCPIMPAWRPASVRRTRTNSSWRK